jgi:hypothetical protein
VRAGIAAFVVLSACSSSTTGELGSRTDSSVMTMDSGQGDGGQLACAMTLDAYCAGASCIRTWSALTSMCMPPGFFRFLRSTAPCDGYDIAVSGGVDTSTTYYYDHATGQLVAILDFGIGRDRCAAGPPSGFAAPSCQGLMQVTCDAG